MKSKLYHHGILGQKWGIRRYQPYPKDYTGSGKEIGQAANIKRIGKKINKTPIQQFASSNYYVLNDIVLKKGDYLYRADANDSVNPNKKAIYTSLKESHLSYLNSAVEQNGMTLDLTLDNKNEGRPYSLKLQLQDDLIIPSYKKSVLSFLDTIKDIPANKGSKEYQPGRIERDRNEELLIYEKIINSGQDEVNNILKAYNKQTVGEVMRQAYSRFVNELFMNSDRRTVFFNNLEKQGYSAIVDTTDYNVLNPRSAPMIVFKKESIKQVGSKPVTEKDKKYIYDRTHALGDEGDGYKINDPNIAKEWDDWLTGRPKSKK